VCEIQRKQHRQRRGGALCYHLALDRGVHRLSLGETASRFQYLTSADRKKAFQKAIEADSDRKIFNDQFIEGLSQRLDSYIAIKRRILIAQYAVLLCLAATLLSLHFTISLAGISSDAKSAREFLLVISSSLLFFDVGVELQQSQCWELLEALLEKRAGNNPLILKALTLRYAYEGGAFILDQKGAQPGRIRAFLMRGFLVLLYGWNFIVTVAGVLGNPNLCCCQHPSRAVCRTMA
jgi:hypothetical protein